MQRSAYMRRGLPGAPLKASESWVQISPKAPSSPPAKAIDENNAAHNSAINTEHFIAKHITQAFSQSVVSSSAAHSH